MIKNGLQTISIRIADYIEGTKKLNLMKFHKIQDHLITHAFNLARATLEFRLNTVLPIHSSDSNEILAKKLYTHIKTEVDRIHVDRLPMLFLRTPENQMVLTDLAYFQ